MGKWKVKIGRLDSSPLERFWLHVSKKESGCWLWIGYLHKDGYGQIVIHGKKQQAHRFAYQTLKGEIPIGTELDHLCRIPSCVNPDHLEPVTHQTNMLRGTSPVAIQARMTECKNGHPFNLGNTYLWKHQGGITRRCKECYRRNRTRYHHVSP